MSAASFEDVFADVQRSKCTAVYASSSDLKLLLDAFRRDKIDYQVFPEFISTSQLSEEQTKIADAKAAGEKQALERRRKLEETRTLQAMREALSHCRIEDVTDHVGALSSRRSDGVSPRLHR